MTGCDRVVSPARLFAEPSPAARGAWTRRIDQPAQAVVDIARNVVISARLVQLTWSRLIRLGQALPAMLILRGGQTVLLSGFREFEGDT